MSPSSALRFLASKGHSSSSGGAAALRFGVSCGGRLSCLPKIAVPPLSAPPTRTVPQYFPEVAAMAFKKAGESLGVRDLDSLGRKYKRL